MPDGLARLHRERSLSSLTRNLFELENADAATRRRAERALLSANPWLANREEYAPGRAIVVPVLPDLRLSARVEIQKPDLDGLLSETARRLQEGANITSEGAANAVSSAKAGLARLSDRRLQALVKKQKPEVSKLLEQSQKELARKAEGENEQAKRLAVAFEDAQSEFAKLTRRAGQALKNR